MMVQSYQQRRFMIEVERKYRIKEEGYKDKIVKLGFSVGDTVRQIDKVFLLNSKDFSGFTVGDPVARIRVVDSSNTLTIKRAVNSEGDVVEHETGIDSAAAAEGMLTEIGFSAVTVVNKKRTEFKKGDVVISIDSVESLGDFIEVEVLCAEGEEDRALEKVIDTAASLGLGDDQIEPKKYDQLISEPNIKQ